MDDDGNYSQAATGFFAHMQKAYGVLASDEHDPGTPVNLYITIIVDWTGPGNMHLTNGTLKAAGVEVSFWDGYVTATDLTEGYIGDQGTDGYAIYEYLVTGYQIGDTVEMEFFAGEQILPNVPTQLFESAALEYSITIDAEIDE